MLKYTSDSRSNEESVAYSQLKDSLINVIRISEVAIKRLSYTKSNPALPKTEIWRNLQDANTISQDMNTIQEHVAPDLVKYSKQIQPQMLVELKLLLVKVNANKSKIDKLAEDINDQFDTFYKISPSISPVSNNPYNATARTDTTIEGSIKLPPLEAAKLTDQLKQDYLKQKVTLKVLEASMRSAKPYPPKQAYNDMQAKLTEQLGHAKANVELMFKHNYRQDQPRFYDAYINIYSALRTLYKTLGNMTPREH